MDLKLLLGPAAMESFHKSEEYKGTSYLATGLRFVLTRRSNPNQIQVYLFTQTERLKHVEKGDTKAEKDAFAEIFHDAGWQTEEILEAMRYADDFYCERPFHASGSQSTLFHSSPSSALSIRQGGRSS